MFALLRALPLLAQLGIAAGLLGTIGIGAGVVHHKIYQSGYDAAIADVDAENKEGVNEALDRVKKRRDCAGTWSQSTGECLR